MRTHLTYANVMATIAVFSVLGGTAWGVANIGQNDIEEGAVHRRHINDRAVSEAKIQHDAITSFKVLDGSLKAVDFAAGELPTGGAGQQGSQGNQGIPGAPGAAGDLLPAGAVSFFDLAACPSGWSELTAARGRYVVGLPSGGLLGGTDGTALTDREDRPVGQHDHGTTDPGHQHAIASDTGGALNNTLASTSAAGFGWDGTSTKGTRPSNTGVTVDNAGAVAGTNAPYLQLLACKKN